jgi:hypothetical protein
VTSNRDDREQRLKVRAALACASRLAKDKKGGLKTAVEVKHCLEINVPRRSRNCCCRCGDLPVGMKRWIGWRPSSAAEDPAMAADVDAPQTRYAELSAAQAEVDRLYARWAELEVKL